MSSAKIQGHTGPTKCRIENFRTLTPFWFHPWLWNDAHSLTHYRRGAIFFSKVFHQMSRSYGLKNRRFESNLSKITRPVAAIKSIRLALFFSCLFGFCCNNYQLPFKVWDICCMDLHLCPLWNVSVHGYSLRTTNLTFYDGPTLYQICIMKYGEPTTILRNCYSKS